MINQGPSAASGEHAVTRRDGVRWESFLVAIPLLWVIVALVHPQGSGDVYEGLRDEVGLWIGSTLPSRCWPPGSPGLCGSSSSAREEPRR